MNSKWHLGVSITKSLIRIIGCAIGIYINSISLIGTSIIIAEVLGIVEELGDKR